MDELQIALAQLQSSNLDIRESAIDRIGTLNPDNAFEIILPFLADVNSEIRGTAACNLGEIDDLRSVKYLIDVAENDAEETVRIEALSALDNFRSLEISTCLINEIYRPKRSRRPRQIVAQQLQYYNDERTLDALSLLLLEDEDVYVRIFAADSLILLNQFRLLNIWEQALHDESTYVVEIARRAIEHLKKSLQLLEAG
jgi:HEAT repeat protein